MSVSNLVCPPAVLQMFQAPALIWMTIAATRMYRSLTDFPDSGYYTSRVLRHVVILTAAEVAVLLMPLRLRLQIPNKSSKCKYLSTGWR
jgi:hypothetical protein